MDRHLHSEILSFRRRDEHSLSPQERSEAARRRILDAVATLGTPAGRVRDQARRDPFASMGLALLAGFVIGYSSELRDTFMTSAVSLVQALLRKW